MNPLVTLLGLGVTLVGLFWDKVATENDADKKELTPAPIPASVEPVAPIATIAPVIDPDKPTEEISQ